MIFEYGIKEAERYGLLIREKLSGKKISKSKNLAEAPGGLIYEAKGLGMDMWVLLKALEGMCKMGTAAEIDDSTYLVM